MVHDELVNRYFEWLYDLVSGERFSKHISYRKLFMHLHRTEFIFSIPKDENRAEDGVCLRRRFGIEMDYPDIDLYLDGPCSILEMMIALSVRCEETIMDDPAMGNRTGQWFWGMIVSLGLGSMDDSRYDRDHVDYILDRFLNREYESNGKGGLFTIKDCRDDLRTVEIWIQLLWYLDSIYV